MKPHQEQALLQREWEKPPTKKVTDGSKLAFIATLRVVLAPDAGGLLWKVNIGRSYVDAGVPNGQMMPLKQWSDQAGGVAVSIAGELLEGVGMDSEPGLLLLPGVKAQSEAAPAERNSWFQETPDGMVLQYLRKLTPDEHARWHDTHCGKDPDVEKELDQCPKCLLRKPARRVA